MGTCRCRILNVLSGELARDLLDEHLHEVGNDGVGRTIYLCEDSEVEWLEEQERGGYDSDVIVLRRVQR